VFTFRRLIAWATIPLAQLLAGPLVDLVFEPLTAKGGPVDGTLLGKIVGIGPGRGICFLFTLLGFLKIFISSLALLHKPLWDLGKPYTNKKETEVQNQKQE